MPAMHLALGAQQASPGPISPSTGMVMRSANGLHRWTARRSSCAVAAASPALNADDAKQRQQTAFIFGLGYTGIALGNALAAEGW